MFDICKWKASEAAENKDVPYPAQPGIFNLFVCDGLYFFLYKKRGLNIFPRLVEFGKRVHLQPAIVYATDDNFLQIGNIFKVAVVP